MCQNDHQAEIEENLGLSVTAASCPSPTTVPACVGLTSPGESPGESGGALPHSGRRTNGFRPKLPEFHKIFEILLHSLPAEAEIRQANF